MASISDQCELMDTKFNNIIRECCNVYGTDIKISTMTILTECDHEVDLAYIAETFETAKIQDFIKDVLGDHAITSSKNKRFCNCIIFKVMDKQSVKVFCNGNLHITGAKTIKEALDISEIFATMFELMYGGTGIDNMFQVDRFHIQMINLYFKLPFMSDGGAAGGVEGDASRRVLSLAHLLKLLQDTTEYYCNYNNERHAGVIIRMLPVTILIFDSGNVIITAAVTEELIRRSLAFVFGFFNKNKDDTSLVISKDDDIYSNKKMKVDYSKYTILK